MIKFRPFLLFSFINLWTVSTNALQIAMITTDYARGKLNLYFIFNFQMQKLLSKVYQYFIDIMCYRISSQNLAQ